MYVVVRLRSIVDHLLFLTSILTLFLDKSMTEAIKARGFHPDDEINHYSSVKKMREAHSFMDRARKRSFCKTLTK